MSKFAPTPEEYRAMNGIPETNWSEVGPELLEACKKALCYLVNNPAFKQNLEDLIAKAEGR